jgi:hypothetical protein
LFFDFGRYIWPLTYGQSSVCVTLGRSGNAHTIDAFTAAPRRPFRRITSASKLGHTNLGMISVYLQGIDSGEVIDTVHARRAPIFPSARHSGSEPPFEALLVGHCRSASAHPRSGARSLALPRTAAQHPHVIRY